MKKYKIQHQLFFLATVSSYSQEKNRPNRLHRYVLEWDMKALRKIIGKYEELQR